MQKNGARKFCVQGKKVEPFLVVKSIFEDNDKSRAMLRLNGYRTACLKRNTPIEIKRANIIKELMKTL